MSRVRLSNEPRVVCLSCGDLHLSEQAPVSRGDDDWFEAMSRPLRQLRKLREKYACAVLCAGDIFDKWNCSPSLINFALRELPQMYAVPGQHDLPYHRYEDLRRSAYWTLCEAGKVCNLVPGRRMPVCDEMLVSGFPWGTEVAPTDHQPLNGFNVAVIHSYIWKKDCGFPGADPGKHLSKWAERLKGYRVAVFGDNHSGFMVQKGDRMILNGGSFMRRKSDEADYRPFVGLIWSDGSVTREYLDTSEDVLLTPQAAVEAIVSASGGFESFLESVRDLGTSSIDFVEAVGQALDTRKASNNVREAVHKAIERK